MPATKTPSATTLVDYNAARDIVWGQCRSPFDALGLQQRDGGWLLTVFVPGAESVTCVTADKRIALDRLDDHPGLFITAFTEPPETYSLEAMADGYTWSFDYPYRFGPVLTDEDIYFFGEGSYKRLWKALGAHVMTHEGTDGTHFAVWAPNARRVSVVGNFNVWDGRRLPMRPIGASGVWELFVPGIGTGEIYKYEIIGPNGEHLPLKADPFGYGSEHPPATGSVVRDIRDPAWSDADWIKTRADLQHIDAPISIYEVNLASWKRAPGNRPLSYLELAEDLVDYAVWMGFTHIELMPISEHPFDGSWGYQPVGLYAPTIRHGTPDEFRALVNAAHRKGLGVLLDWVPGHFPIDAHGLSEFDGTHLYEHADPREGFHQDWNTLIPNFGRTEVANHYRSNALYWLEEYHLDGLRVDAVASMLYRDYSRKHDEWVPNKDGGRENYEAIALLQTTNTLAYGEVPGIMTVAEESTAFPGVSRPVEYGGLGFGFKWNMGWMNDSLRYMEKDPIHRRHHHHEMTFSLHYAFGENYVLPISHDEVVHGKGSMLTKMPGNAWEKFANLRAYYGFMWTHPGKKLLFMGQEFAQSREWNHNQSLDWHECDDGRHKGVQMWVRDLNTLYRATPALHVNDVRPSGFQWLEANDTDASVFAFVRIGGVDDPKVVVVMNMTPIERTGYRIGLPAKGRWREALNSDAEAYGGGGRGNMGGVDAETRAWMGQDHSAEVTIPPLSTVIFVQDN
ncbi:1,4-alpha-glucan branching enzyme [Loktanella sp. DSM 29012]|uniref:1,4-alpha-glucan branching protein GlgB n=1 Tax=Loktanella sp. DSM 29012 TaxID=1881056 RepID=UPI0008BE1F9A|nr:1,4-alpha-glucan branching protein GlgB [Loktanella sp. DSM 29012]SEQ47309.1 1,4-alpha-glucan branching enzyme [Loktanella sp. DSM 29012]